jgi:FtsZ-interacting cell division protein ZipA
MIIILGLVILIAAVVAGVAGVLTNGGHGHELSHFSALGYHVTGSTGTLFLYGIVVGAIAMAGLALLLGGARRTSRRGSAARRGLKASRRETATVASDRDDLIDQRDTARAYTASNLDSQTAPVGRQPGQDESPWAKLRKHAAQPAIPDTPEPLPRQPTAADQPAPEVPAGASASAK